MEWHKAIENIANHTVKVITPNGHGSGFLISSNKKTKLLCIATAAHVVDNANYWEQPIRIQHAITKKEVFLRHTERAISVDSIKDTASVTFLYQDMNLGFPDDVLPFTEEGRHFKAGVDVGWIGFPAISSNDLCFFNGRISCWIQKEKYYLVDGVAINGVSGGPAFTKVGDKVHVMGLVSAYIPNQTAGIPTPGLCVIRDMSHAREIAQRIRSFEEALEKAENTEPPESHQPSN